MSRNTARCEQALSQTAGQSAPQNLEQPRDSMAPARLRDLFGFGGAEKPVSGQQLRQALQQLDQLGYDVEASQQRWTLSLRNSLQVVSLYSPAQVIHFAQTRADVYSHL